MPIKVEAVVVDVEPSTVVEEGKPPMLPVLESDSLVFHLESKLWDYTTRSRLKI